MPTERILKGGQVHDRTRLETPHGVRTRLVELDGVVIETASVHPEAR